MGTDLKFSCACGAVAGYLRDLRPDDGDHVICHCRDCRNFARYLGADTRVLQRHGGTALYQTRCARLRISSGRDKLSCLHLTDKPTLRWYASCCRTPMFNTYANGRIPYITTLFANCDPAQTSTAIGPVTGHLNIATAVAISDGLPRMAMHTLMRRFLGRMVRDVLSGDRRHNALFDAHTFAPIARPYRLTPAERAALAATSPPAR